MTQRTTLVFLRHGQTDWNVHGRFQGQADEPLNDVGREQARRAATAMADQDFAVIIASPLVRAYETAQIVAAKNGSEIGVDDRLMEIDCGSWEGRMWTDITSQNPELVQMYTDGVDFRRSPEGETIVEMVERARPAVDELLESHRGQRVLVVAHGLLIQRLVQSLLGLDPAIRLLGSLGNACSSAVTYVDGKPWLAHHNVAP